MYELKNKITDACKTHRFVGIVCEDGHEHTVKAWGNICGTPFDYSEDELENQLIYCEKIAKGFDVEILIGDTFEDAVKNNILEDTGEEGITRYGIK